MTARRFALSAAAMAGLVPLSLVALAQTQNQTHQPDPKHGATIAAQGTAAGAPACVQCHAISGESDPNGAFPRIVGQWAYYQSGQLRDFASGVRASDVMSPVAEALSPDDVADVAAYYAGVNAPFPSLEAGDPALIKQGEKLADWREFTAAQIARVRTSPEGQEGLRAFLEKRPAKFKGK